MTRLILTPISQRVLTVDTDSPRDEQKWIVRLRDHEAEAWGEFISEFRDLVLAVIRRTAARRRMTLQPNDVDDLSAEVFAAALKSLERFRRECRLSTWITSITRRVVDRELSRPWRLRVVRGDVAHAEPKDRAGNQPLENLLLDEKRERLEAMLGQLPAAFRNVLRMHYVERLSYHAIGRRLGVSVNSVGPLLHRGRKRLRELLRREADSGERRMLDASEP